MASAAIPPQLAAQLSLLRTYQTGTLLGALLSSACFGVFCVQLYTYATAPATKNEPRWLHALVAIVAALELTHTILLWMFVVDVGNKSLANPLLYAIDTPVFIAVLCVTGIIGAIVQSYYSYRIYRFCGHIWFSLPSWVGSIVRAGITLYGSGATTIRMNQGAFSIYDFKNNYGWVMEGTLSASVATDVLNTFFLCWILYQHRTGMGVFIVDKLIVWTVETGFLTSCIAISLLAVIVVGRYELLPGLYHVYPNMFSLSLIFTLNTRDGLRRALHSKLVVGTSNSRSLADSGPVSPRTRTFSVQKDAFGNDVLSRPTNTFKLDDLSRDRAYGSKDEDRAALTSVVV